MRCHELLEPTEASSRSLKIEIEADTSHLFIDEIVINPTAYELAPAGFDK